jgi:hypothetical protein
LHLQDLFPSADKVRRIYCDKCSAHLDLCYLEFDETISEIQITVSGLPVLKCPNCEATSIPDRSCFALIHLHKRAMQENLSKIRSIRNKAPKNYGFTKVPFVYDSDDYEHIPGLSREVDVGYLTPAFFSKEVLLKYEAHPSYRVIYCSRTYGSIYQDECMTIPFGINRNGKLVMWLGDIAKLPDKEQYYLASENVDSDHSIGSEFYDGQIECKFTEQSPEDLLFEQRSKFLECTFKRFGKKFAHLDKEVLDLVILVKKPVIDTYQSRRDVADALNKIYIESFDGKALETWLRDAGVDGSGLGSLKRLQKLIEITAPNVNSSAVMVPLFALYDLRVAWSHLMPDSKEQKTLEFALDRLELGHESSVFDIYDRLLENLTVAFQNLEEAVK